MSFGPATRYRQGGTRGGQDQVRQFIDRPRCGDLKRTHLTDQLYPSLFSFLQFKWEDVKTDRQRDNYLGASLYAAQGRWQKGRDLQWFNRTKAPAGKAAGSSSAEQVRAEIEALKQAENDALSAALGYKVEQRHAEIGKARLSKEELAEASGI